MQPSARNQKGLERQFFIKLENPFFGITLMATFGVKASIHNFSPNNHFSQF